VGPTADLDNVENRTISTAVAANEKQFLASSALRLYYSTSSEMLLNMYLPLIHPVPE